MKTPLLLGAIALAFAALPLDSQCSMLDTGFDPGAGPDGAVYAIAEDLEGRVLVGGGFTNFAGNPRAALVRLFPDGRVDDSFAPQIRPPGTRAGGAIVTALCPLPQGGVLIGGTFAQIEGQPANLVARLLPDGRLDESFATAGQEISADKSVRQIALLPDGSSLIAGTFKSIRNEPRPGLAKLGADGQLDASFLPALSAEVYAMQPLPDGRVLILASRNSANPNPGANSRVGLTRLNSDGSRDNSFSAPGTGIGTGIGHALAVRADGTSIVCGDFKRDTQWVTAWDFRGNRLLDFPSGVGRDECPTDWCAYPLASSVVTASDGGAWIGGAFENYAGRPWKGLARIDKHGCPVPDFAPGAGIGGERPMVLALLRSRTGALYAGGEFTSFDGISRKNLLRLAAPVAVAPRVTGAPAEVVVLANQVARLWVEVAEAPGLEFRWEFEGNPVAGAASAQFWIANASTAQAGRYVCRVRNAVGEASSAPILLRVKPRQPGQVDPDFDARASMRPISLPAPTVHHLLSMPGGRLMVAGDFATFNGEARTNLVKLNRNGSLDPLFRPVFTSSNPLKPATGTRMVYGLASSTNSQVYVAGRFDRVNGQAVTGLVRLGQDGNIDESFQPRFKPDLWRADASVQLMWTPRSWTAPPGSG